MLNLFSAARFFVYISVFSLVIVSQSNSFPFVTGKYIFFRMAIELSFLFFLIGVIISPFFSFNFKYLLRKIFVVLSNEPLVASILLFVALFSLSGFLGYDRSVSFWSSLERGDGIFQMIHYLIFFLLLRNLFKEPKYWSRLFYCFVFAIIVVILYDLPLLIEKLTTASNFLNSNWRFSGALGNSAYLGSVLLFVMFYVAYLFSDANYSLSPKFKRYFSFKTILLIIVYAIIFFLIFFTRSRSALLGFLTILGTLLTYRIIVSKKTIVFVVVILGTLISLVFVYPSILNLGQRAESIQTRISLWQISLIGLAERPLLGWGPENFTFVSEKYLEQALPKNLNYLANNTYFDRAHSIFFDYAVSTGILGLLSYLFIFAVFYWQYFRRTGYMLLDNWERGLFLGLPFGYLVQGIGAFDSLAIYLNLFVFFAFANYQFISLDFRRETAKIFTNFRTIPLFKSAIIILIALMIFLLLYISAYLPFIKSRIDTTVLDSPDYFHTLQLFQKKLNMYSPIGHEELLSVYLTYLGEKIVLNDSMSKEKIDFLLEDAFVRMGKYLVNGKGINFHQNLFKLTLLYKVAYFRFNDRKYNDQMAVLLAQLKKYSPSRLETVKQLFNPL